MRTSDIYYLSNDFLETPIEPRIVFREAYPDMDAFIPDTYFSDPDANLFTLLTVPGS